MLLQLDKTPCEFNSRKLMSVKCKFQESSLCAFPSLLLSSLFCLRDPDKNLYELRGYLRSKVAIFIDISNFPRQLFFNSVKVSFESN